MVIRTRSGNVELRTAQQEFGSSNPWIPSLAMRVASSGVPVTQEKAAGVPAVLQGIRVMAHLMAQLPIHVYTSKVKSTRQEALGSWQANLFSNANPNTIWFNMLADISAGIDFYGNAFLRKIKSKGQIVELDVLDPERIRIYQDPKSGQKMFEIYVDRGANVSGLTAEDIIHFRGFDMRGQFSGLSLTDRFRGALGDVLAAEEFAGRYFANGAIPGGYLKVPDEMDQNLAREMLELWEERHGGVQNAGKPAILMGGTTFESMSVAAQDSQLLESRQFSVEEISRMIDCPIDLLQVAGHEIAKSEELMLRVLPISLVPRAERIKQTFNEDLDLFGGSGLSMDFDYNYFQITDAASEAARDLAWRQAGIYTANEIRARRGDPPIAGGDVLQMTPVGGQQNPGLTAPEPQASSD